MRFTEFHNQDLAEGPNDPNIFKAVFMAGASGSGKSSVSQMLFSGTGLKPVNVDTIENYYRLKQKDTADRSELHKKRRAMRKNYLHGRLGLVIDGTGRDPKSINKNRRFLEAIGYETALVYVDIDLETSLRRVADRAQDPSSPDYGREIDSEKVKQIHQEVNQSLEELRPKFTRVWEVSNSDSDQGPQIDSIERSVLNWLNQPVNNEAAQQWLEQQADQQPSRSRPRS